MSGRLARLRVVVTRAAEQADALAELIDEAGGVPVVVPLIDIVPTGDVVGSTAGFDWVVVTSPNGAPYVADLAPGVRLAAVGRATAAAVAHPVDLVPVAQRAAGLVDEFDGGPGRVLVVQAVDAAPTLVDGLRSKGWTVVAVTPYRSVARLPTDVERDAVAEADVLTLASGSAARAWVDAFGLQTCPIVVAIGPQCADTAISVGIPVTHVAADHSLPGLVAAIPTPPHTPRR